MQTLQILDGADSFLRPLEGRTVVLGAGPDVDVRLQSDDVAGRHAQVEFRDGTPWLHVLEGTARVNGRPVQRCALALGDRIELGAAVVVLGRSVARAAEPDDVLAASRATRTRRRGSRHAGGANPLPWVLGGLAALAVVAFLFLTGGPTLPSGFLELDRLRRAGSFELAQAQIDRLRDEWAVDAERRELLQREVDRLEHLRALVRQRRDRILAQASTRTYADFSDELQRDERRAEDDDLAAAARIVRASLSDLLRGSGSPPPPPAPETPVPTQRAPVAAAPPPRRSERREAPPRAPEPTVTARPDPIDVEPAPTASIPATPWTPVSRGVGQGQGQAKGPEQGQGQGQDPPAGTITVSSVDVDRALDAAAGMAAEGDFRGALGQIEFALAGAASADVPRLREHQEALRRTARLRVSELLARARSEAEAGRGGDMIAELQAALGKFPGGLEFAGLPTMIEELQRAGAGAAGDLAAIGGADAARRRETLAQLAPLLERVRAEEQAGAFAAAGALLEQAAGVARERDPGYADSLLAWHADMQILADLHQRVRALVEGGTTPTVRLAGGDDAVLRAVDEAALVVRVGGSDRRIRWFDLAPAGVQTLAERADLDATARLGAAALLYQLGAPKDAERLLAAVLGRAPDRKAEVDRIVARGRGEPIDPRGYELRRGEFVSAALAQAEQAARKVLTRMDRALRSKDAALRAALFEDALALGPNALEAVVIAFRRALEREVAALETSPLRKQLDRIAAQRRQLDEARATAKELIFDEERYFYPYSPPQVSPDRYAEYSRVQQEVNRRVDAIRSLWDDDRYRVRVPATVTDGLDRIDWVAQVLSDLGELDALALVPVEWARALVPGQTIGIRTYCLTVQERLALEEWDQVMAYNEQLDGLDVGQRTQLRVTNEYRMMFHHRPVAADLQLCEAATGHAEEMSKLGYFSHFSPTEGRRTPGDRMKLAGYEHGAGENIAISDSATSAHLAWCQSSGHHRNLLMPTHTELGVGGVGRYWVQNFGRGTGYQKQLPSTGKSRR
ncbi:MAG: CAP domain-containing protein [Planctomycetota bacterium]